MVPAKTTFGGLGGFIPNPKLRLQEQVPEVARFKPLAARTEETYWAWIVR